MSWYDNQCNDAFFLPFTTCTTPVQHVGHVILDIGYVMRADTGEMEMFASMRAEFKCEDEHKDCAAFAERGDCLKNAPWMVSVLVPSSCSAYNSAKAKGVMSDPRQALVPCTSKRHKHLDES